MIDIWLKQNIQNNLALNTHSAPYYFNELNNISLARRMQRRTNERTAIWNVYAYVPPHLQLPYTLHHAPVHNKTFQISTISSLPVDSSGCSAAYEEV